MSTPDLSKAHCEPFLKPDRKPKEKKKSAAEKRAGMSERHRVLLRQLPCCIGQDHPGGEVHHLKFGTGERGMGLRSTDKFGLPMCHAHHIDGVERAGSRNEHKWFRDRGVSPLDLAAGLWLVTGKLESMLAVMKAHRSAHDLPDL
jgi:hypothetical protein